MNFEVNNEKNQHTQAVSAQQSVGNASTSTGAQSTGAKSPINLKLKNKILEYIESDNFKKLSPQEQTESLKEKFPALAQLSPAELYSYLGVEDKEKPSEISAETNVSKSEVETLAEAYATEIGFEGDYDDLISSLIDKAKADKLSPKGQKLLASYRQQEKLVKAEDKPEVKSKANLGNAKKYLSADFKNLSPEQKINRIVTDYLNETKSDADFQSQKELIVNFAAQRDKVKNAGDKHDKALVASVAILTKIAQEDNITLERLTEMPTAELDKKVVEQENRGIRAAMSLFSKDELKNIPYSERIEAYTDAILTMTDNEYASLKNDTDRKKFRDEKIDEFIVDKLGNKNWNKIKNDPVKRNHALQRMALAVEQVIANTQEGGSIVNELKNYEKRSLYDKNLTEIAYLQEKQPQTPEDKKLLEQFEVENMILGNFKENGIENPSPEQILAYSKTLDVSGMTKNQREYLSKLQKEFTRLIDLDDKNGILENLHTISQEMQLSEFEGTREEYIANALKDINSKNLSENVDNIKRLLLSVESSSDIDSIQKQLLAQGISKEKINGILSETEIWVSAHCRAGDAHDQARLITLGKEFGINAADEVSNKVVSLSAKWYKKNSDVAIIGNTAIEYQDFQESFSKGVHTYRTRESAAEIFKNVATTEGHSQATLASFSETFIKTANSDADRLYHAQRASEISNPAVLEGVAAASKYVTDSKIKSTYTSVVKDAAKNYSKEVQQAVSTAIETGKISEKTLSQTTVSAKSETTSTQNNKTTSSEKATSTQAATKQTAAKQANQVSAKATTNTNINVSSKASSVTSAASQASTTNATTTADLEAKKQEALDKLATLQEDISTAVKEWNEKHEKKISEADEEEILEVAKAVLEEEAKDVKETSEETSTTNGSSQEVIKSVIAKASSIGEVYDILVTTLGESRIREKFIDALMASSSDKISSFINSRRSDTSLIKELYEHCTIKEIKKELISLMGDSAVKELLSNNEIVDFSDVPINVLIDFFTNNPQKLRTMSSFRFKELLSVLPPEYQKKLQEMRNGGNSNDSVQAETGISQGASTVANSAKSNTSKLFADGETTKTLNDGTIITREGTSTGKISDGADESYKIVEQGSDEWYMQFGSSVVGNSKFQKKGTRWKSNGYNWLS